MDFESVRVLRRLNKIKKIQITDSSIVDICSYKDVPKNFVVQRPANMFVFEHLFNQRGLFNHFMPDSTDRSICKKEYELQEPIEVVNSQVEIE